MNTLGATSTTVVEGTLHQRIGNYFRHPINTSARYGRKICPFGQHAILALVLFLWVRWALVKWNLASFSVVRTLSIVALVVSGVCSLLNMNAVLYIIPYIVIEVMVLVRTGSYEEDSDEREVKSVETEEVGCNFSDENPNTPNTPL